MTSAVHLAGDWSGAVLLECDGRQACRFADRFLSMDPSGNAVVDDVRARRARRTGQHDRRQPEVRVEPGDPLSMPSVVDGSDYSLRICGAEVRALLAFDCAEGVIWIRVLAIASEPDAEFPGFATAGW